MKIGLSIWHEDELSNEIAIFPMKVHRKLQRKIALPGFRNIGSTQRGPLLSQCDF